MKIMFVCTGNTCRSPLAQALMIEKLKKIGRENIIVDSCGIYCESGVPISENSRKVLEERGIEFSHASKSIQITDLGEVDYFICMTKSHKMYLSTAIDKNKIYCFDDITHNGDILDPYGQDIEVYRKTAAQIDKALDILISKIK